MCADYIYTYCFVLRYEAEVYKLGQLKFVLTNPVPPVRGEAVPHLQHYITVTVLLIPREKCLERKPQRSGISSSLQLRFACFLKVAREGFWSPAEAQTSSTPSGLLPGKHAPDVLWQKKQSLLVIWQMHLGKPAKLFLEYFQWWNQKQEKCNYNMIWIYIISDQNLANAAKKILLLTITVQRKSHSNYSKLA